VQHLVRRDQGGQISLDLLVYARLIGGNGMGRKCRDENNAQEGGAWPLHVFHSNLVPRLEFRI
jgi:hypothetical protein